MPDSTRPARHRRRCRAPPQVARDLFAQRASLRLVACQLGRRQLSALTASLLQAAMGKQRGVGAARGEWRFGGLRLVRRRHRLLMRQRARRPPGRETGRASAALPVLSLASAPGRPALSWQSLAEEVIWNDGRHICTRPDRAGRSLRRAAGRRPPRPWTGDAPALRQAARGRQARAGRQRAPEHALADLAIDPGLLGFAIARRVDGQVRLASWRRADAGVLMTRMTWMAYSWRRLAHSPCQPATATRALRPGAGQEPVGKVAC